MKTIIQFLDDLKDMVARGVAFHLEHITHYDTKGKLEADGWAIRAKSGGLCPICEVNSSLNGIRIASYKFHVAANTLGLSLHDATAIVDAADARPGYDVCLRYMLEKACGLSPI